MTLSQALGYLRDINKGSLTLFYQGKGGPDFSDIAQQLNAIQQQGRDSTSALYRRWMPSR